MRKKYKRYPSGMRHSSTPVVYDLEENIIWDNGFLLGKVADFKNRFPDNSAWTVYFEIIAFENRWYDETSIQDVSVPQLFVNEGLATRHVPQIGEEMCLFFNGSHLGADAIYMPKSGDFYIAEDDQIYNEDSRILVFPESHYMIKNRNDAEKFKRGISKAEQPKKQEIIDFVKSNCVKHIL